MCCVCMHLLGSRGRRVGILHRKAQRRKALRQLGALLQRHEAVEAHAGGGQRADQHTSACGDKGASIRLGGVLHLLRGDAGDGGSRGQGLSNGADAGAAQLLLVALWREGGGRENGKEGRQGWLGGSSAQCEAPTSRHRHLPSPPLRVLTWQALATGFQSMAAASLALRGHLAWAAAPAARASRAVRARSMEARMVAA